MSPPACCWCAKRGGIGERRRGQALRARRSVGARQQLRPARADDRDLGLLGSADLQVTRSGKTPYNGQKLSTGCACSAARWLSAGHRQRLLLSQILVERQLVMPSSSVAARSLALAVLALGAAPAFAQDIVACSRRACRFAGAPGTYERSLPPPPPGPIESRLVNAPAGPARTSSVHGPGHAAARPDAGAVGTPAAIPSIAARRPVRHDRLHRPVGPPSPLPPRPSSTRSPSASPTARCATSSCAPSPPIPGPTAARSRWRGRLVVRSYLMDKGVKSRIEVGSHRRATATCVEILVPST